RNSWNRPSFRPRLEALEERWCPSLGGREIQVNTTIDQDQAESANATSANGSRVVVWTDYSTGNGNIKAQRFDGIGHRVGGEISVAATVETEHEPDVAMDANGNFVVVWTVGKSDEDVLCGRALADGAKVGDFTVAATDIVLEFEPSVAMQPGGKFLVSWTTGQGAYNFGHGLFYDHNVTLALFDADGTAIVSGDVYPDHDKDDGHPSVAAYQDGFALVFDRNTDGVPGAISVLVLYDPGLNVKAYGTIGLLGSYTAYPDVALNASGQVVVVVQSGIGSDAGITAGRVSANASGPLNPLLPSIAIAQTSSFANHPSVALDDNGKFVVAYQT